MPVLERSTEKISNIHWMIGIESIIQDIVRVVAGMLQFDASNTKHGKRPCDINKSVARHKKRITTSSEKLGQAAENIV